MENYKITFKSSVVKDLRAIPAADLSRIDELTENPRAHGCIKLSGNELYRIRQGNYRIVYEIRDGELMVVAIKIGHRSSLYAD